MDWDIYEHDMNELGDRAAGIIKNQRQKIDYLETTLSCLIEASGGSIFVPNDLFKRPPSEASVTEDSVHDGKLYSTRL